MTVVDTHLEGWRSNIAAQSARCPWPGPRPLTINDDAELLCGREKEKTTFRQDVDENKLVILHGFSGIGKTSLLTTGLIPSLEASGYLVAVCREWGGTVEGVSALAYLAREMREQLGDAASGLPEDGPGFFKALDRNYGNRVVLVLDQFEELIRDAPVFKDNLIKALVRLNHSLGLKVVISLRSEHKHELRDLENQVKPYSMTSFFLEEIGDEHALDVIVAGRLKEPSAIDDDAAEMIAVRWIAARRASQSFGQAQAIGLLHLQALLFALHAEGAGAPVGRGSVEAIERALCPDPADEDPMLLFDRALQHAVEIKLDRCREAAVAEGLDALLVGAAALDVRRTVAHLSSGGFKIVRDVHDLLVASLSSELENLERGMAMASQDVGREPDGRPTDGQVRALLLTLLEPILAREEDSGSTGVDLFAPREALARRADERAALLTEDAPAASWTERLHAGAPPRAADAAEVTSGPMLGLAPAAVFIEEVRRFVFALEWLQRTDTVRLSSPGGGAVMVALIHDRFGAALERWSRAGGGVSLSPLYGITAALGADFDWGDGTDDYLPELDGGEMEDGHYLTPPRVIVNLRWRGCRISANLRSVAFVNCDFKGSSFDRCRLEGVTFVNCLLDGLMFTDCTIIGAPPSLEEGLSGDVGAFEVHRSTEAVRLLDRYQQVGIAEGDIESHVVVSSPPELPATPGPPQSGSRVLEPHNGGVSLYGGRISSLVIRSCRFPDGAVLSFREAAGSGVDVVEHQHRSAFEILSCRLRHLTFSSSPTSTVHIEEIEMTVDDSVVAQTWFGSELHGQVRFTNSMVLDLWNGSPALDVAVGSGAGGEPSSYHGLVGVRLEDGQQPLVDGEVVRDLADVDGAARRVTRVAVGMDYRRHPSDAQVRGDDGVGAGDDGNGSEGD